jgi:hypothetical protein
MEQKDIKETVLELIAKKNALSQLYEENAIKELGDTIISLESAILSLGLVNIKKEKKEKKEK